MPCPQHDHKACNALIRTGADASDQQSAYCRLLVSQSIRAYRMTEGPVAARRMRDHAHWIGLPVNRVVFRRKYKIAN